MRDYGPGGKILATPGQGDTPAGHLLDPERFELSAGGKGLSG